MHRTAFVTFELCCIPDYYSIHSENVLSHRNQIILLTFYTRRSGVWRSEKPELPTSAAPTDTHKHTQAHQCLRTGTRTACRVIHARSGGAPAPTNQPAHVLFTPLGLIVSPCKTQPCTSAARPAHTHTHGYVSLKSHVKARTHVRERECIL